MSDTMIDRESVIRQLTQHIARADYIETDWMDCVSVPMLRDALALLREQEPRVLTLEQEPIKVERHMEETEWNVCGNCGSHVIHKWAYCPYCGKRLKWDE